MNKNKHTPINEVKKVTPIAEKVVENDIDATIPNPVIPIVQTERVVVTEDNADNTYAVKFDSGNYYVEGDKDNWLARYSSTEKIEDAWNTKSKDLAETRANILHGAVVTV